MNAFNWGSICGVGATFCLNALFDHRWSAAAIHGAITLTVFVLAYRRGHV